MFALFLFINLLPLRSCDTQCGGNPPQNECLIGDACTENKLLDGPIFPLVALVIVPLAPSHVVRWAKHVDKGPSIRLYVCLEKVIAQPTACLTVEMPLPRARKAFLTIQ